MNRAKFEAIKNWAL